MEKNFPPKSISVELEILPVDMGEITYRIRVYHKGNYEGKDLFSATVTKLFELDSICMDDEEGLPLFKFLVNKGILFPPTYRTVITENNNRILLYIMNIPEIYRVSSRQTKAFLTYLIARHCIDEMNGNCDECEYTAWCRLGRKFSNEITLSE